MTETSSKQSFTREPVVGANRQNLLVNPLSKRWGKLIRDNRDKIVMRLNTCVFGEKGGTAKIKLVLDCCSQVRVFYFINKNKK